jgi:hypothetical protein
LETLGAPAFYFLIDAAPPFLPGSAALLCGPLAPFLPLLLGPSCQPCQPGSGVPARSSRLPRPRIEVHHIKCLKNPLHHFGHSPFGHF